MCRLDCLELCNKFALAAWVSVWVIFERCEIASTKDQFPSFKLGKIIWEKGGGRVQLLVTKLPKLLLDLVCVRVGPKT